MFLCLSLHFVSCLIGALGGFTEKSKPFIAAAFIEIVAGKHKTYDLESLVSPCSFGSMMALRSTETHKITLKNLILRRPKALRFLDANQTARFVNYYC